MKKLILNFYILLSINFSFAQTDLVKKKIIEKYNIKNFEVLEPFNGGYEINYSECINYLIKLQDGSFKIYDNSNTILLSDHFINYQNCISYKISINTTLNGNKEWLIYEKGFPFYSKPWSPIRIPFETYDKILLGDDSEFPNLIGVKGKMKTKFSLDFSNQNLINSQNIDFYGDADFLETNKTYFPYGYGRIAPYEIEKNTNCKDDTSPYCNKGKIIYRYSDDLEETNSKYNVDFDSIIAKVSDKWTKSLIVEKEGFLHVFNPEYDGYELKKIDGFTDHFAYNNQGIYKFFKETDPPRIFLPIHLPKDVIIKKDTLNGDVIYSFNELKVNSLTTILKLNFTKSTISIIHNSVEEKMSFEEYALKETEKRKDNSLQKLESKNPIYDLSYNDASYEVKFYVFENLESYNIDYTEKTKNYYENSDSLPFYYQYFKSIPHFFDIDDIQIKLILIEKDKTYHGAALFYDNFYNFEGASASARLKALDEIIKLFPTISELYYYRSYLNFNLNNNQEALDDINKCVELDPTIRNYIRRIVHSSYSVSSFEKNKLNIYNDINAAINLLKLSEGENYWVDYCLYWAKINFLLENKILSKNKKNEEVCIQVNSILDLLNNKLIDRKDLLQGELEKIENIKQKSKCK
ncbi:hypothetical protein [Flavobacterium sp.]|uniref:hypothetical protein n=1 Tax=Flavobacterium sp. TaxID=239 RepID=UPI00333EF8F3